MPSREWAQAKANKLLKEFKRQKLVPRGWKFAWMRTKTIFGQCDYDNKLIKLSIYYVEYADEANIVDTIKHEIAHIIAGVGTGHGPKWKEACKLTGATPKRLRSGIYIPHSYEWICPVCCHRIKAHRKPYKNLYCARNRICLQKRKRFHYRTLKGA